MDEPTIPIAINTSVRPSRGPMSGLSTANGLVSCGWSAIGPVFIRPTTKLPAMPIAAHQATDRQRGERRWPSGNSASRNVAGRRMNGIQERSP